MEFAVSRDGTTLVTLHEGTDTTACAEATTDLAANLESLTTDGTIANWEVADATVYEHPTAPFDPYTITVEFTVTAVVDAADEAEAEAIGASAIDEALENVGVEAVSYTSSPVAIAS